MPTQVGASFVPTGNPTTGGTASIPAGVVAGDVVFVLITSRDSTGAGTLNVTDNDTGGNTWTKIGNSTDHKITLWYKRATSGTAGKTVTVAGAVGSCSFVGKAFTGVHPTATPYADINIETNASGDVTHAGFTPTNAGSMVCAGVVNYANDNAVTNLAFATLGALTVTEKLSTGGSDCGCIFGHKEQVGGPTATGNLTWTQAAGTTYSIRWSIVPAPTPSISQPSVINISTTSATPEVLADNSASGTGYFVIQDDGIAAPSATQIKAGQDGNGFLTHSGSLAFGPWTPPGWISFAAVTTLTPGTQYDVYFIVVSGGIDSNIVDTTFRTVFVLSLGAGVTPSAVPIALTSISAGAAITPTTSIATQTSGGGPVTRDLSAAITPTTELRRSTAAVKLAGVTSSAIARFVVDSRLAAAIASAGVLARAFTKPLSGSVGLSTTASRATQRNLAAASTSGTVLSTLKVAIVAVGGALAPSGAFRAVIDKLASATVGPAAVVRRSTAKGTGAVLSLSTVIDTLKGAFATVTAGLTPTAGLSRAVSASRSAAVGMVGAVVRRVETGLAATVATATTLARETSGGMVLSAVLSSAGVLRTQAARMLTAAVGSSAGIQVALARGLTAVLAISGSIAILLPGGPTIGQLDFTSEVLYVARAVRDGLSLSATRDESWRNVKTTDERIEPF